jgi:tetratricopeptide (TPR) repeat protein
VQKEKNIYQSLLKIKQEDLAFIPHQSDSVIMDVVKYYESQHDRQHLPEAYYYAGRVYADLNDSPTALIYFHKAIDMHPADTLREKIYSQMGYLYMYQSLYGNAEEMFRNTYQCSVANNDTLSMAYDLRDLANACMLNKKYQMSEKYLFSALRYATLIKNQKMTISVEDYLSILYNDMGNYPLAKRYLQSSLQHISKGNESGTYTLAAEIYAALGDNDSAAYFFGKVKKVGSIHAKREAYNYFTKRDIIDGNATKALQDFDTYDLYMDTLDKVTSTEACAKATSLYNYSKWKINSLNLQKANTRMHYMIGISITTSIIILLALLLIRQHFLRKRQEMKAQMEKVKQVKDAIYKRSLEFIRSNEAKMNELKRQLDSYGRENEDMRAKIEEQQQLIISQDAIAKIENEQRKKTMENILKSDIYRKFSSFCNSQETIHPKDRDWDMLNEEINTKYPDFKERMNSLCRLNENEYHVCLLIKIHFPPNKIAQLTNHSTTSVSATRRRLYEKVFKAKGKPEDWDEFVRSI